MMTEWIYAVCTLQRRYSLFAVGDSLNAKSEKRTANNAFPAV